MRRMPSTIMLLLIAVNLIAQSPHGKNFKLDCSDCHNSDNWKVKTGQISFNHSKTGFPLIGQHKTVECKSCHAKLVFSDTKNECFNCHLDIHKSSVSNDCSKCHSPQTWLVNNINDIHLRSRFPLLGSHLNQDCSQCHINYSSLKFDVTGIECYDCHRKNYEMAKSPDHVAGNISKYCLSCHSITSLNWNSANTTHDFFPLKGGHALANCFSCHKTGTYSGLSKECYSCHKTTYDQTTNPNHMSAGFSTTCNGCHTINVWVPSSFNHATTGFAITGKHIGQNCVSCHSAGYANTPSACYGCHQTNYIQTTNPNHTAAGFPNTCADCHTTNGWTPATFDHDGRFFPIYSGKHQAKWNTCTDCHNVSSSFAVFTCISCHEHNQTDMNQKHLGISGYSYLSSSCYNCHPAGSKDGAFNHSTTRFPLLGSHTNITCAQCHTTGYSNTSMECVSCHQIQFNNSRNPNHIQTGISTDCKKCHNSALWVPSLFSHSTTAFALSGKHSATACEACHKGTTTGTSTLCYTCHKNNYDTSTNPNHSRVGISTDCSKCHNSTLWTPSIFTHSATAFPLTGIHLTTSCESCHKGNTTGTSAICYSCHKTNYDATTNPNHLTSNIPNTCSQCHTTSGWSPAAFNHTLTKFPLLGSHATVSCQKCHSSGYTNTSTNCVNCHQTPFNNSRNPNHLLVGISTDCIKCHNSTAWIPSVFSHSATAFVLTGIHITTTCESCHKSKTTGTSTLCYSCHKTNYDTATNPNHVASNIPTTCAQCHTTSGWSPATFDHSLTKFLLTGKHTTVSCISCHKNGYSAIPTDCYSCHQSNYTQTTNPNHTTSNFPTTCADCHTTNGWTPATFDHDGKFFPIYSGKHQGEWNTCADCHNVPTNYGQFTCINCHEHTKTSMDSKHRGVTNYSYLSTACYTCHPKGRS